MTTLNRRRFIQAAGATAAAPALTQVLFSRPARAAIGDTLNIAYMVSIPSWDPTTGLSAVNPTLMSIYKSVFDQYIDQNPDLSFKPGIFTEWGWNADKTQVSMTVRQGAKWHDGKPVTAEDIVWNLKRAADPKAGNPVSGLIWATVDNYKIQGNKITGDVKQYVADYFKWMAFLTGYVIPPHHYEKVGKEGFEQKPMGSGPYMVEEFQRGSFVRLKASPHYWGPKPAFENVVFKFITDPTARVAEIESGRSDLTLQVPFEEFDRLKAKPGLVGVATPVSDIAMIFFTNVGPMLDENVRKAAVLSVDKEIIVKRLLRGYGVPLSTLEAPQYAAFDPSIKVPYNAKLAAELLAKSGHSPKKPVKFTIQTTRGYMPKDYEIIQAIVGMWRKIGIEADIEVYEVAKHFELRAQHKLAPAAFYNWGNSTGDPNDSTGHAMFSPSPHSAWKTKDVDALIGPLWGEKDEAKRIAGWKKVDRYIADHALVLPLYQQVQPVVHKAELKFTPHVANYILPATMGRKA
jgi:peptide/nickel transport system substrate-binding protein